MGISNKQLNQKPLYIKAMLLLNKLIQFSWKMSIAFIIESSLSASLSLVLAQNQF